MMHLFRFAAERRTALGFAALFLAVPAWSQTQMRFSRPLPTVAEQYLLRSINAERAAMGLRPVRYNPELQQAAFLHAVAMARTNTLTHQLHGEPDLSHRGWAAGAKFSRISENVGVGPSIIAMHDALMHSPHHRENILDSEVDSVGVSVVQYRGALWAVEDFDNAEQEREASRR